MPHRKDHRPVEKGLEPAVNPLEGLGSILKGIAKGVMVGAAMKIPTPDPNEVIEDRWKTLAEKSEKALQKSFKRSKRSTKAQSSRQTTEGVDERMNRPRFSE